jgi:hypothetical protein
MKIKRILRTGLKVITFPLALIVSSVAALLWKK